ncbi:MAG: fibronectin type III domain-containing protein [Armatimonadota bacterium]
MYSGARRAWTILLPGAAQWAQRAPRSFGRGMMVLLVGVVMTGAAATGANLLPNSEELETWEARDGAAVAPNVTAAPDGNVTADRIQDGPSGYPYVGLSVSAQAAGGHVFSCYLKAGEQNQVTLRLHNLDTKLDLARTTFNLSSGWQRFAVSGSGVSVGDRLRVFLYPGKLGSGSGGVFAWGAQLEAGTSPGAYQKTPAGGETPGDTTPPAAPSGLTATWTGTVVQLTWNANTETDLAGYHVERGVNSTTAFSPVATPVQPAYQDGSVLPASTYSYRVQAVDAAGNVSGSSSLVSVTIPGSTLLDTTPPAVPSGLTASWTGSAVALKWTANSESDLAGYRLERGTSATSLSPLASPSTPAYQDGSVSAGATYYYRVKAVDKSGNVSGASAAVSVSVPASPPPPTSGSHFYVAPNGSSSGDGSLARPWDLKTAFAPASAIKPGSTVWLRGGRYGTGGSTVFECRLAGTASAPIIVRQYPRERATVDGGIYAKRGYVWFWGFEITNTSLERNTTESYRPIGLRMDADGQKAINLVINNTGRTALSFHKDVEVYGCLMWGNGHYDPSKEGMIRGGAVYGNVPSSDPNVTRYIRDIIAFRNFRSGIKIYSETADRYVNGFHLEGNLCFDAHIDNLHVTSRANPVQRLRVLRNYTYDERNQEGSGNRFGYETGYNEDAIISGNRFVTGTLNVGALRIKNWRSLQFTDNHVISPNEVAGWEQDFSPLSLLWDRNRYFGGDSTPFLMNGSSRDFPGWQSLARVDANSRHDRSHPTGTEVFVRPNLYEAGRGHVAVYNWSRQATVEVDVSGLGLKPGQSFEVLDAQNYFGAPVATGVFDGSKITLPLELTETTPIWGTITHIGLRHTSSEFNAFVVRPLP